MRNYKIFPLVTLLFFSFMLYSFSNKIGADQKTGAIIYFEKTIYDFGKIKKESNAEAEFKIYNKGDDKLMISRVTGSCGCVVPNWPKTPIIQGKFDVIKVKYDTKILGEFNKSITVVSNSSKDPIKVVWIKGNVIS